MKLTSSIQIVCHLLIIAMSQYNNNFENAMPRSKQYKSEEMYRRYHRRKNLDCECSCSNCLTPKPCCLKLCENCPMYVQQTYLFYPYPVPIIITELTTTGTPNTTTVSKTTDSPTSSLSTTMSTAPYYVDSKEITTVKREYMKLKLQCPDRRKCVNNRISNYNKRKSLNIPFLKRNDGKNNMGQSKRGIDFNEIIPIPDSMAYDIISKLRKVKDLQVY